MRTILIDAATKEVKEIETFPSLHRIRDAIGVTGNIDFHSISNGEQLWTGTDKEGKGFFKMDGVGCYEGNGIIIATNTNSGFIDTKLSVEEVKNKVRFAKS